MALHAPPALRPAADQVSSVFMATQNKGPVRGKASGTRLTLTRERNGIPRGGGTVVDLKCGTTPDDEVLSVQRVRPS